MDTNTENIVNASPAATCQDTLCALEAIAAKTADLAPRLSAWLTKIVAAERHRRDRLAAGVTTVSPVRCWLDGRTWSNAEIANALAAGLVSLAHCDDPAAKRLLQQMLIELAAWNCARAER